MLSKQDTGEFNIATSSLHALSNNMTSSTHSSDKHSPHTSPRFSRRSTTPSLMAVQNDLYAGHIPTLSLVNSSANYITAASAITGVHPPSAPPMNVVNGSNGTTNAISSSSSSNSAVIVSSAASTSTAVTTPQSSQKSTNRMSAPLMGTNAAAVIPGYASKMSGKSDNNDNSNSSYAILQNLQESQAIIAKEAQKREANSAAVASVAPPLPPRKSSPGAENTTSSIASNVIASNGHINGGGAIQKTPCIPPQTSKSVDNIVATLGDICVPKTTAPPIPPHNTNSNVDTLVEELRTQRLTNTSNTNVITLNTSASTLLDDDIVGPAETIMGVIDTRPLEARSSSTSNYTQLCTTTTTNSSTASLRSELKNQSEKLIEIPKQIQNQTQQQHHQKQQQQHHQQQKQQPLLYENVSINQKGDCSVPYENINLEYIARLMNEGYSKENAITALGISRNNIEMACDILREFVAKNSV